MDVLDTDFFRVTADSMQKIVWLVRKKPQFTSIAELRAEFGRALVALDGYRVDHDLIIDMRDGPMRNEADFEEALGRARERVLRDFRRVAVLVRTAAGSLQVKRHIREDKLDVAVFQDEREAIRFLLRRISSA